MISTDFSSGLDYAIKSVGAKRVVLDTIEALFAGLSNQGILRAELRRLFRWLKDQGVTAIITAERGDGALTRHGLEEYVSDCVIMLDHRVVGAGGDTSPARRQISRRGAWRQRISIPDRRRRHLRHARHVARSGAWGGERADHHRRRRARRNARRQRFLARLQHSRFRHGRHRQVHAVSAFRRRRLSARRKGDLFRL